MTSAIPVHVALVDQTGKIDPHELATVAGALNSQVQNDFVPIWSVAATVGAYPTAPANTWAIIVQTKLDQPGALGYHTDNNNQPISYVEYTPDYSVTVSHELLEMLADPYGSRVTSALCPQDTNYSDFGLQSAQDPVSYLVEVSDPCESKSYLIGGVDVSDFLLPGWYRSAPGPGVSYSHTGFLTSPREVADGGYASFSNHNNEWWQVFNTNGQLAVSDLGSYDKASYGALREWIDEKAQEYRSAQGDSAK